MQEQFLSKKQIQIFKFLFNLVTQQ